MKLVLKTAFALTLCALPWLVLPAAPPPGVTPSRPKEDARVRAALVLAQAGQRRPAPASVPKPEPKEIPNCGCDGPDCRCEPGKCTCKPDDRCTIDCDCKKKKALSLNTAIDLAIIEHKPLCIWVKQVCVPCQQKMPGYLHVHVSEYERVTGQKVEEACVIVARPVNGEMIIAGTIPGCPDDLAEQAERLLNPRPVFFAPPPPPPMFFGGMCGGGG